MTKKTDPDPVNETKSVEPIYTDAQKVAIATFRDYYKARCDARDGGDMIDQKLSREWLILVNALVAVLGPEFEKELLG